MTDAMTRYFNLFQFFGGYLGQDWPDEYANEWDALDDYLRENPVSASRFCPEAQALLDEHLSEEELHRFISYDLACAFAAEVGGWKYRDWLQALSDHAAKRSGTRRPHDAPKPDDLRQSSGRQSSSSGTSSGVKPNTWP
jgi:hypothetical protein